MVNLISPTTLRITAHVKHAVPVLNVRNDALIWVRSGEKRLFNGVSQLTIRSDSIVLLPRDTRWSLVNDPFHSKVYVADVLEFGDSAISIFFEQHGADFPSADFKTGTTLTADPQLAEALLAYSKAQSQESLSLRLKVHRSVEILILLAERGFVFLPRTSMNLKDQLIRLVAQAPHSDWNLNRISGIFHISESTLRRRLSAFGVTAYELVNEVRLDTALSLLQSTTIPVGEISRRCGYESHSRFSAAFRQHFGYAPSHVRNSCLKTVETDTAQELNVLA